MKAIIDIDTVNAALNYLVRCPYAEVYQIIEALKLAKPIELNNAQEVKGADSRCDKP